MTDRTIRNLAHLGRSASTARVLNLLTVARTHAHDPEWAERPLFGTPALNRALIIKHRLRRNEIDLLSSRRSVATKVVIPVDETDLRAGGRYFFVGQYGFERALQENFGIGMGHPDVGTLALLDSLPSLDPFLMREQLRQAGREPAALYFAVSDADLERMTAFVQAEIRPLVALSLQNHGGLTSEYSALRLTGKILSNAPGDQLESLRVTLRLEPEQYQEGIFCWKGFLYYKWVLAEQMARVAEVSAAVMTVAPIGPMDRPSREYIARGRDVLRRRIVRVCEDVRSTLSVYDVAYAALVRDGDPVRFRDFLMQAPALFTRLGEQLGALQHVVTFWRYRFNPGAGPVSVEELIDIFMDFEAGLRGRDDPALELESAA